MMKKSKSSKPARMEHSLKSKEKTPLRQLRMRILGRVLSNRLQQAPMISIEYLERLTKVEALPIALQLLKQISLTKEQELEMVKREIVLLSGSHTLVEQYFS